MSLRLLMLMLVVLGHLAACVSQPRPLKTVPDGTSLAYSVIEPDHLHQPAASNATTSALNMAGGAAAGIGAGAAYGAYAGLGCGPMLIICSPAGAVAGAMGGGIFGLGVGTYQAAKLLLPANKAAAMNAVIEDTFAEFPFSSALDAEFRSRATSRWRFDDAAAVELSLSLVRVELKKHADDHLSVRLVTKLVIADRSGHRERIDERLFPTESLPRHVDTWLDNDGAAFRLALEDGISRMVHDILWQLSGY